MPLFTDDSRTVCDLLRDNWNLGMMENPNWYQDQRAMTRNNRPGSIYVYMMGPTLVKSGIDYSMARHTSRLSIDIQVPQSRERIFKWVNEVLRILYDYRRGGKCKLNGWDYIDITSISPKTGYTSFYHVIIDIALICEVRQLNPSGFNNPCIDCHTYAEMENEGIQ